MNTSGRPKNRSRFVAVAVAVVIGLVSLLFFNREPPRTLDGAISIASDEGRFDSSSQAGESFLEISERLLAESRQCVKQHNATYRPCAARSSAVALAQSAAVVVLGCTQPGVHEARFGVLRSLQGIKRLDVDPNGPLPPFPTFPVC